MQYKINIRQCTRRSGLVVVSASDCSVRGPRFESHHGWLFITTAAAIYSLGHGLRTFTAVPRSTKPSTVCGMVKWHQLMGWVIIMMWMWTVVNWLSLRVGGHLELSLHSSSKLGKNRVNSCIGSEPRWQHHKHYRGYYYHLLFITMMITKINAVHACRCCCALLFHLEPLPCYSSASNQIQSNENSISVDKPQPTTLQHYIERRQHMTKQRDTASQCGVCTLRPVCCRSDICSCCCCINTLLASDGDECSNAAAVGDVAFADACSRCWRLSYNISTQHPSSSHTHLINFVLFCIVGYGS